MSPSSDALTVLRSRRCDLYEQLALIDGHVAAVHNSPFFGTRAGNSVTMRESIEGVEGEIADINRQLGDIEGELPMDEAMANPS